MGSGIARRKAREAKAKQNGASLPKVSAPFGFTPRIFKILIISFIATAVPASYVLLQNRLPPVTIPYTTITPKNEDLAYLAVWLGIVVFCFGDSSLPDKPEERRMMGPKQLDFLIGFTMFMGRVLGYAACPDFFT